MNKMFKWMNSFYHAIPLAFLNKVFAFKPDRRIEVLEQNMIQMCKISEKYSDYFFSYRVRPTKTERILVALDDNTSEQSAIVMQGPIMLEREFTFETIKLYKKLYPKACIIVSTWYDESQYVIEKIKDLGVTVVLSQKPVFAGHGNINYQLDNTKAGVLKAKEMGAKYICKTRTDQRIYHPNFMEYMINLIKAFPNDNSDFKQTQEARIICLGMEYGNMFYPFFMSDFMYFGTTKDICQLFETTHDLRTDVPKCDGETRRTCASENRVAEIQILRQYIDRMGGNTECTIKSYWNFVKNHLICINKDEIGLYWPKYFVRYTEHVRNGHYHIKEQDGEFKCYNWDFINWFNLYSGTLIYREEYEKYADFIM